MLNLTAFFSKLIALVFKNNGSEKSIRQLPLLIKHSAYNNADLYERVLGLIEYINALRNGLFTDTEIDEAFSQAQQVYFVDYFNCEFENGSFHQYFLNSMFSKDMQSIIMRGLKNMNALKQFELFKEAITTVETLLPHDKELYLSSLHMHFEKNHVLKKSSIRKAHNHINKLADQMFEVLCKDPLVPKCYKYIESLPNLRIVPDDQYDLELSKILKMVPNYLQRKKEAEVNWEKAQPRYCKIAPALCKEFGIELKSINVLDFGEDMVSPEVVEENYKKQRWHYHISTNQGYMYIVDDWDSANLYRGDTRKAIGSIEIQNES
jgi:hypothetical protein